MEKGVAARQIGIIDGVLAILRDVDLDTVRRALQADRERIGGQAFCMPLLTWPDAAPNDWSSTRTPWAQRHIDHVDRRLAQVRAIERLLDTKHVPMAVLPPPLTDESGREWWR